MRKCLVALAGWLLGAGAYASPPTASDLLAGLEAWLASARTLRCRFEQRLVSDLVGETAREEGVLYLARPGRMRWEYLAPERKIALAAGDRAVVYLPETGQWIEGGEAWREGPLWRLLAGDVPIAELFAPSIVATPERGGEGGYRVRLVPRQPLQGIVDVTLWIEPPEMRLRGAEVLDEAGNRIEYRFLRIRTGVSLDEGLFRIEPPAGVEILRAG